MLSSQAAGHYTVLLALAPRTAQRETTQKLRAAARRLPLDSLYLYPTADRRGVPHYGLSYGLFADRASAARALASLPAELRSDRPLLRSIGGIREEMWRD